MLYLSMEILGARFLTCKLSTEVYPPHFNHDHIRCSNPILKENPIIRGGAYGAQIVKFMHHTQIDR